MPVRNRVIVQFGTNRIVHTHAETALLWTPLSTIALLSHAGIARGLIHKAL